MKGYCFITDATLSRAGNISDVQNAVAAGVTVVQYRRKDAATANSSGCFTKPPLAPLKLDA
jgi:thiamine monophosphate synthase